MYTVIEKFQDKDGHIYKADEEYPAEGKKATARRIKALLTDANDVGRPFIVEVPDPEATDV